MAKLTKTERLHFQTEWLDIWRREGKPQLNQTNDLHAGALSPFSVSHWGYAQQTYGTASRLSIRLGGTELTRLVALLRQERISGPSLFPMINVRSSAGRDCDMHRLGHMAYLAHKDAALALRDVEALRACDALLSAEKEAEWLTEATAVSAPSQKRKPRRL
jgi:hypothetical protein